MVGVILSNEEHVELLDKIKKLEEKNKELEQSNASLSTQLDAFLGNFKLINWIDFPKVKFIDPKVIIKQDEYVAGEELLNIYIEYKVSCNELAKMKMKGY